VSLIEAVKAYIKNKMDNKSFWFYLYLALQSVRSHWYLILFKIRQHQYAAVPEKSDKRRLLLSSLKAVNEKLANLDRLLNRAVIRNYPVIVTLQTTWRCNLKCPMCFRRQWSEDEARKNQNRIMPEDDFIQYADLLFPYAKLVNISVGGEPLLNPYLDSVMEKLDEYQCKLEIFTNITVMKNHELIDTLFPHIGCLRASVDGANKETFEKIRKGADFNDCVDSLKYFGSKIKKSVSENQPEFKLWVTIQADNFRELPEIVLMAFDVGATEVGGQFIMDHGGQNVEFDGSRDDYLQVYEATKQIAEQKGITITELALPSGYQPHHMGPQPRVVCPYLWSQVILEDDNTVLACCLDAPPKYPGNILKDGFQEVWNSSQAQNLRKYYLTDRAHVSCRTCCLIH